MSPEAYLDMAGTEDHHWWFQGRRRILGDVIRRLSLPTDAAILEIGSGTGGNLDMLAAHGRVHAVEMDTDACAIARQKTGGRFDIRQGHCPDDMPFDGSRYDLVCLFDCLEHIGPDVASLRCVRDRLAPGGAVLVSVPANAWMWSQHDVMLHHHRRYSRQTLTKTVESAGLAIERLTYFNTALFPLAVVARMKDRLLHASVASGTTLPPSWLNTSLYRIFSAERWVLPHVDLPFGVSLLAVLRAKP
ncbi:class I SAM-dependent methyltransferase [Pandoraea cepalis]|uniref:Ubiquinone biosynthesis O-methyltransferase n=1 Tax=Pandoraea cepalis TaxID=2508294 RepID=A0A5E4XQK5_9BURK|nr:class I SAM-dependent methyltransferase [Pandoraea cepalis]VVE38610.1 Ubiquinone biosynthesis O-methyltransferase [Pandoraea cepalis]